MKKTGRRQVIAASSEAADFAFAIAIIVIVITPLRALAAAPTSRSVAQVNPRFEKLQIEISPEFDRRQAALVILKGELAADVVLPATVSLRIPASSGGPTAVAFSETAEGELFNLGHERTNAADFITLHLQASQRFFHVEFYDPLTTSASDRSYLYVWPGDFRVGRLGVRIQQPASASGFSVRPEPGAGGAGPDGLRYWTVELGAVGVKKQIPIEIRYTKTDPRTTAEILGLKTPDPMPKASTVTNGGHLWGLLVFAAILALVAATWVAATWWWRRRKTAPGATQRGGRIAMRDANSTNQVWMLVFASWLIAAIATLGALFFGEVMKVPTCALCWYQRIFMFPLILILPVGLFPFDPRIVRYAIPLSLGGWAVALFHVLVVAGYIPENVQPCTQGVPCSETYIQWFGFVTIPLLALVAFSLIIALLAAAHLKVRT